MRRIASTFSNFIFIVLFPGFFFWHFGLASGAIPIRIGLYGEISAAATLVFLTIFIFRWVNITSVSNFATVAIFLFLYCFFWTIGNVAFGEPPPGTVMQVATAFPLFFALLSVGAFMDIDRDAFRRILIISFVGMVGVALWYSRGLSFNLASTFNTEEGIASYQGLSRSTTITSILLLSLIAKTSKRLLFSAVSIFVAFLMGARSELFGLIFSIILIQGVISINDIKKFLPFLIISFIFVLVVLLNIQILSGSRQFEVLNLAHSSSWMERAHLSAFAWGQIVEHPVEGVFGGHYYASSTGELGSYSHNFLSAWVSFGFTGFLIYSSLIVWALVSSILGLMRSNTPYWRLALYLNSFSFVLIIFAKEFLWSTIALGWGVYIQVSSLSRFRTPSSRPKPGNESLSRAHAT